MSSKNIMNIVNEIDYEILKKQYYDTKDIMKIVGGFIKKKKLLIYGGYALNLLLPKKDKFYKDFTINDYDCFSTDAKNDALELAEKLKKMNYEFIKVRKALHENTYKVYVNFIQIIDITQMSADIYDAFFKIHKDEIKTSIYKYYTEKYNIVPFVFLISNLHYELARPISSYYRWDKVYNRLLLIRDKINLSQVQKNINKIEFNIDNKILNYVKKKRLPIVNEWALQLHDVKLKHMTPHNYIIFLCKDINKIKNEISKQYNSKELHVSKDMNMANLIGDNLVFKIKDNIICQAINVGNDCLSITKKKRYTIGSVDTIMYFLYRLSLLNYINASVLWSIDDKLNNISVQKRLSKKCYGVEYSLKDVLKKNWGKRQTIKYVN
jgi:hypothetical protein